MIGDRPARNAPLPHHLSKGCSAAELDRVRQWWTSLSIREQRSLVALCDPRADACPYHRAQRPDGYTAWNGVNIRVKGRFVDATKDREQGPEADRDGRRDEDCGGRLGDFPIDFYEYLVNHELSLGEMRSYHICTQHEAAAEVVRAGMIPATFACPLGRADCPMRRVLAVEPGRSLRLEAVEG